MSFLNKLFSSDKKKNNNSNHKNKNNNNNIQNSNNNNINSNNSGEGKKRFEVVNIYDRKIEKSTSIIPNILIKHILNIWLRYFNMMTKTYNNDYFIEFINIVSLVSREWISEVIPGLNLSHTVDDTFNIHSVKHLRYATVWLKRGITASIRFQLSMSLSVAEPELVTKILPYTTKIINFRVNSEESLKQRSLISILEESPFTELTGAAVSIKQFKKTELFETDKLYLSNKEYGNSQQKVNNLAIRFDGSPKVSVAISTSCLFNQLYYLDTLNLQTDSAYSWFDENLCKSISILPVLKTLSVASVLITEKFLLTLIEKSPSIENLYVKASIYGLIPTSLVDGFTYSIGNYQQVDLGFLQKVNKCNTNGVLKRLILKDKGSTIGTDTEVFTDFLNETKLEFFLIQKTIGTNTISLRDEAKLMSNRSLKFLSYYINHIKTEIWPESNIKYLRLRYIHGIHNYDAIFTSHINTLVQLSISNSQYNILEKYLMDFLEKTKILKYLKLTACQHTTPSLLFDAIAKNRSLETFVVSKMPIRHPLIAAFISSNHPTIINFAASKLHQKLNPNKIHEAIAENKTLVHLSLSGSLLDNPIDNINLLIRILKSNTTLFHLDFSWISMFTGPPIDKKLFFDLTDAIINNPVLLSLDIYHAQYQYLDQMRSCYQRCLKLKVCPFNFIEVKNFDQFLSS